VTRLLEVGTAGYLLRAMAGAFMAGALWLQVCAVPTPDGGPARLGLVVLAVVGLVVWFLPRSAAWLLVPAAAGLAWARAGPPLVAVPSSLLHAQPRAVVVEAQVRWALQGPPDSCAFEVDRLTGVHPELRVWVRSSLSHPPPLGARIRLQARARLQRGRLILDHAVWQACAGVSTPPSLLQRTRSWVRTRLQARLPRTDAGLARALLLGESQAAPGLQRAAYRQLGLLHLLCISGLHFWVWGGLLRRFLPGPCARMRWPCLIALAGLAQFSAPVLRAATALALREWMAARGRACLAWQLWACALWVELTRSDGLPMGLLLSYAATAGLLWAPSVPARQRLLRVLLPSAAAFLATAPILHSWQATLEPWSIPLTPLFALLLPFRLLASVFSCAPFGDQLGRLMFAGARFIEHGCLEFFSGLPGTPWPLPHLSRLGVLLACGACLLLMRVRARAIRNGAMLLGLCVLLAWSSRSKQLHAAHLEFSSGPGRWLIAAEQAGSLLMPLDGQQHATPRQIERSLLPALARAKAGPPWQVVGASPQLIAQLNRHLPGVQPAPNWQMDPRAAFCFRSWPAAGPLEIGAASAGEILAWQVSREEVCVLILLDTQPSALRSLARQLAPQDWSALVLPGKTPQHSEFSIFHAQLGKPPVFDLNEVPRNTP
jgi:predicted membrane metal-binding protein